MDFPPPEIESVGIVLVGAFNPTILQPAWFASEELLRKGEAAAAQNLVVSKDFTAFSLDWLVIQATTTQVDFYCEDIGSLGLLRDLVLGTFRLLSHTPVETFSIAYHSHFRADSEETWHKVGDTLAPKAIYDGLLRRPGMLRLDLQAQRDDDRVGEMRLIMEPSNRVKPGVYLAVNNAIDLRSADGSKSLDATSQLSKILTTEWSVSIERGREIAVSVLKRI